MPKRRTRRVKYAPSIVVLQVLSDDRLAGVVSLLVGNRLVGNGELAERLGLSTGYVNYLCRKLEKWGVLRAYRDPVSGRILWSIADTKTARLVINELRKRESERIARIIEELLGK